MTKSKRLKPIIKIAEEREQVAVRGYLQAQQTHNGRLARLDELVAYREEYQGKFISTDSVARTAFQFNDYRAFLLRLDAIIEEQKRLVALSATDMESKRIEWLKKREKSQSLEKVAEKFMKEEQLQQNQKEQKEADERSQRYAKSIVDNDDF